MFVCFFFFELFFFFCLLRPPPTRGCVGAACAWLLMNKLFAMPSPSAAGVSGCLAKPPAEHAAMLRRMASIHSVVSCAVSGNIMKTRRPLRPRAWIENIGFFFLLPVPSSRTSVVGSSSMKPFALVSVRPLKYHSLLPFSTNQRLFHVLIAPPCFVRKPSLSCGSRLATETCSCASCASLFCSVCHSPSAQHDGVVARMLCESPHQPSTVQGEQPCPFKGLNEKKKKCKEFLLSLRLCPLQQV